MEKRKIIFLGDSFTWGEGLELYSDNPKWIAERYIDNNNYVILKEKQDDFSRNFRNTHRFAGLVSKQLDCDSLVDEENGGTIARNMTNLKRFLIQNKGITDVVLQFSTYSRETLHMSFDCSCDFCLDSQWAPILDNLNMYIIKKLDNNNGDNEIKENEQRVFNFISEKIDTIDIEDVSFLTKADKFIQENFVRQLKFLQFKEFLKLENDYNIKIHFIDSWCRETSKLLTQSHFVSTRLIPLVGKTNRRYTKWEDWVQTFESKLISDDFPITGNGHPTLEMHEYLAKSIILKLKTVF